MITATPPRRVADGQFETHPILTATYISGNRPAPAPVAIASGGVPKNNANEVVMTGRSFAAISSRAFIAPPELSPGRDSPEMFSDGKPI
jgi:hypothetical protein